VDIHCHVTCPEAAAMVEGNEAVSRWFLETQANPRSREINRQNARRTRVQGTSAEQRIADMDLMGIDIQAISPAPRQTYYGADPELGLVTARAINDNIADIVARHPDRFTGLGTVPMQAPELAIGELERLHKSLGMRGIEMMTHGRTRICRRNASARCFSGSRNWDCWCSCIRMVSPRRGGSGIITLPM
jgi:aminocarboxymuconate-semialdehyde decarboxylase